MNRKQLKNLRRRKRLIKSYAHPTKKRAGTKGTTYAMVVALSTKRRKVEEDMSEGK